MISPDLHLCAVSEIKQEAEIKNTQIEKKVFLIVHPDFFGLLFSLLKLTQKQACAPRSDDSGSSTSPILQRKH
jgi:hypothetical protein